LSALSTTPSPSVSLATASQASPTSLPSASLWSGFASVGQLSHPSPQPSPSPSACVAFTTPGQLSCASSKPSPSLSPGCTPGSAPPSLGWAGERPLNSVGDSLPQAGTVPADASARTAARDF